MKTLIYCFTTSRGTQYEKQIEIRDDDGVASAFDRNSKAGVKTLKTLRKLLPRRAHLDYVAVIPYRLPKRRDFKKYKLKGKLFDEC